jgi:glycosyl transferase family 87
MTANRMSQILPDPKTAALSKSQKLARIAIVVIAVELALVFIVIGSYKHFTIHPPGLSNEQGYHFGHDFLVYFTAAKMAHKGRAEDTYDIEKLRPFEEAIAKRNVDFAPWVYPPTFLLFLLPFGLLSYASAYAAWCFSNLAAGAIASWTAMQKWWGALLGMFFPAAWLNLFAGQNGGVTAALMLGGLALLQRHPIAAGTLFGMMSYKPQFGILIPLALAVGGYWAAFAAAAVIVIGFAGVSYLAIGGGPWSLFAAQFQADWTTQSEILWWKSVTVYQMVRLFGFDSGPALIAQFTASLIAAGLVIHIWRRPCAFEAKAAVLAIGTLLATPRAMMYDLTLLLIPFVFIFARMWRKAGLTDYIFLSLLWLCPVLGFFVFEAAKFQVWPIFLWPAILFCIMHYGRLPPEQFGQKFIPA